MQYLTSNKLLIMRLQCELLLSCLLFLIILTNTILCSSHPTSPQKNELRKDPTPLGYLEYIVGSRKGTRTAKISALKKYLSNLGYMDADFRSRFPYDDLFDDKLESALKRYQRFFRLKVTGILDSQTVSKLVGPRCGVADLFHHKRMQLPSWSNGTKRTVTYGFLPDTPYDVIKSTHAGLAEWGRVAGINFQHTFSNDQADIKSSFLAWDEGAGYTFDGPGGVVAYAFAPTDGRIYYDGNEPWFDGVEADVMDLQTVALHELGHILGLGHSTDPGAIMFPLFAPGVRKGLGKDDIRAIRALYKRSKKA